MHLSGFGALALLLIVAHPVVAQSDTTAKPVRVLTHSFTTPSREFVRVRLLSDETYRVEMNRARAKLEVRPVSQGVRAPVIRQLAVDERLSVFLLQPRVSAEYEIRILGGGTRPIVLTIDRRPAKP
jgi:hypothetical protein